MKIAILGYGKEGRSALRFLKDHPRYKEADFVILDQARDTRYLDNLPGFDLIVKAPGVPFRLPQIQKALKRGVRFSSVTQLFFEHAKGTIIGITGTKGKGTVTTLIYKMLQESGCDVYLAGNIGTPALSVLPKLKKYSITVLELSSFQLARLPYSPRVAVVLDVESDHLDWHGSIRDYVNSKASITAHQKRRDSVFHFVRASLAAQRIVKQGKSRKIAVDPQKFELFSAKDMKLPWPHAYRNAVMAASVALYLGVKPEVVKKIATSFRGLPQRLEYRGSKNGVSFYNDSGSTNPHATAAAIRSFSKPTVLIMGGKDRGVSYQEVYRELRKSYVRKVVLYGENKAKILREIRGARVPSVYAGTLQEAVEIAYASSKKLGSECAVLFSPGAASFDMFKNSYARGDAFNAIVKQYLK